MKGYKHKNPRRLMVEKFTAEELRQRLFDRIDARLMPEPNSGCHLWMGTTSDAGYGSIEMPPGPGRRRKVVLVHRVVMERHLGRALSADEFVCHRCDNPPCANPDHLFLGSQSDNMRDCARKNRAPGARLSTSEAQEIRALLAKGHRAASLAQRFGITRSAVYRVQSRQSFPTR